MFLHILPQMPKSSVQGLLESSVRLQMGTIRNTTCGNYFKSKTFSIVHCRLLHKPHGKGHTPSGVKKDPNILKNYRKINLRKPFLNSSKR